MAGMSLQPSDNQAMTFWNDNDGNRNERGGKWGAAGVVGGAILGGGVGWALGREIADVKAAAAGTAAVIKDTEANLAERFGEQNLTMANQICEIEKSISDNGNIIRSEAMANFRDLDNKICNVENGQLKSNYDMLLQFKDMQRENDACCCATNARLAGIEAKQDCCCTQLNTRIDCLSSDINHTFALTQKDNEINILKQTAYLNERFCKLEKGQEEILCRVNQIERDKIIAIEAVEKFKIQQIYNATVPSTATA